MDDFNWPRSASGYTWADANAFRALGWHFTEADPHWVLMPSGQFRALGLHYENVPLSLPGGDSRYAKYRPFRDASAIFGTFAELPHDRDRIREFCDSYGHLGEPCALFPRKRVESSTRITEITRSVLLNEDRVLQSFHEICTAIAEINAAVKAYLRSQEDPSKNNLRTAEELICTKLASLNLVPAFRLFPPPKHVPPLHLRPTSLLTVMWLQLVYAVSQQRTYHTCEICHSWFEVEPPFQRTSRRYCSDACRSTQRRRKQRAAIELHQQGCSVSDIAEQIESNAETVQGWLGRKQRSKPRIPGRAKIRK